MKNIRITERIAPLRIGFIGYNSRLTQDGLRQFVENNKEDIEIFSYEKSFIRLKDGTEIFGLYENSQKGCHMHQMILFDDDRWLIKSERTEFIHFIKDCFINYYSCVPEEYKILEYEDMG